MVILQILFIWFIVSIFASLLIGKLLARAGQKEPISLERIRTLQEPRLYEHEDEQAA